ncbi:MAG: hypothetical protein ACREH8_05375, partial [Opitutaceae bacterium]
MAGGVWLHLTESREDTERSMSLHGFQPRDGAANSNFVTIQLNGTLDGGNDHGPRNTPNTRTEPARA